MIDLLQSVDLDAAPLRRELVNRHWMARDHEVYWRRADGQG